MQRANPHTAHFQVVLSRKSRSTPEMKRAPIAIFLAVTLGVIQGGTSRSQAAPQGGAPQESGAQQAGSAEQPQQGDNPQQPTFRAGVNFVRVDVMVHDGKGQPI